MEKENSSAIQPVLILLGSFTYVCIYIYAHARHIYVCFFVCIYIYIHVHGSPDFQKDRRVFQGCPIFSSTGVRSLFPKELVKDHLNKQKGHMNKIRAFLTARPSEPRRGHVRGSWKDRMGRPASSHVLWTAMTVTSHRSLNGQDPFVQFGVVLCMV